MTPAEHYAEAGRLLSLQSPAYSQAELRLLFREAQVHATLATCRPLSWNLAGSAREMPIESGGEHVEN